jgi:elongation factor P--beta-lysine ligase
MKQVARIIDVNNNSGEVSFLVADTYYHEQWQGALPQIGDTFHVAWMPEFTVGEKLSAGQGVLADGDVMRWRQRNNRMETLRKRHIIKRVVRDYLHDEGFIEIDMPLLVKGTTPDCEIDSFQVDDRYLVSSTEYQIKRMEIGGFDKIYTLTQNFRKGDVGIYRNPEFTMLEWARVGGTLRMIEEDAENFIRAAHAALGGDALLQYRDHTVDLSGPWDRMRVVDAIEHYTGYKITDFTAEACAAAMRTAGLEIKPEWEGDTHFLFSVLLDHIQQFLGLTKPVFLVDWPNFQTSSAQIHESGRYTERSELFIAGIEISDGFPSLTDYDRQVKGFAEQQEMRKDLGKDEIVLDHAYLKAMQEGFPRGAGMALGFDRVVMLLTNQPDIASVLAYQWDEL